MGGFSAEYGIQFLDFLRTAANDLAGFDTLLCELTQNADDSYAEASGSRRASHVRFDVRDDGLLVSNDGIFRSCGKIEDATCAWDGQDNHGLCDFHRFRRVASGNKHGADDVVGAFGVGFVSVYQVTDSPQVESSGYRFTIQLSPEGASRIDYSDATSTTQGTQIWLPWASSESEIRQALRLTPLSDARINEAALEMSGALGQAMLFVRHLETAEVCRNGEVVARVERIQEDERLLVDHSLAGTSSWILLTSDYEDDVAFIRSKTPAIGARRARVSLALPESLEGFEGILYSGLPTRHATGLPFHIDANFFPSSDRKRVEFGASYQGDWNRAALQAASGALVRSLPRLREELKPGQLWGTLGRTRKAESDFSVFWTTAEPVLRLAHIVPVSGGEWRTPEQSRFLLNPTEDEHRPALEELAIPIATEDVRPFQSLMRELGARELDETDLAEGLATAGFLEPRALSDAPAWFQDDGKRSLLGGEARILAERRKGTARVKDALSGLTLCVTVSGWLVAPQNALRPESIEQASAVSPIGLSKRVVLPAPINHPALLQLCDAISLVSIVDHLEELDSRGQLHHQLVEKALPELFTWLSENPSMIEDSPEAAERLTQMTIWPSTDGSFRRLAELALPGIFVDAVSVASLLDTSFGEGIHALAARLGGVPLDIIHYATRQLPAAANEGRIDADSAPRVVQQLANSLASLEQSNEARDAIAALPLLADLGGRLVCPRDALLDTAETRALMGESTELVPRPRDATVRVFYEWLGVRTFPSPDDVIARLKAMRRDVRTSSQDEVVLGCFVFLARAFDEGRLSDDEIRTLQADDWLPSSDGGYDAPERLLTDFQKGTLFDDSAMRLDIPLKLQRQHADFLRAIRIRNQPSVIEVVQYLLRLSQRNERAKLELYQFLDRQHESPELLELANVACIDCGAQTGYRHPSEVFLIEHPFRDYAVRLEEGWLQLRNLMRRLGVKDRPDALDAAEVLKLLAEAHEYHDALDPAGFESEIVAACWQLIQAEVDAPTMPGVREALEGAACVPDARNVLQPAGKMLFSDNPALARCIEERLYPNLIPRPFSYWQAMATVGVRNLTEACKVVLVGAQEAVETDEIPARIHDREPALLRLLGAIEVEDALDLILGWKRAQYLSVKSIDAEIWVDHPRLQLQCQLSGAYQSQAEGVLYYQDSPITWAAVANELLAGHVPHDMLPFVASTISTVLSADDLDAAESRLDELGFPRVAAQLTPSAPGPDGAPLPPNDAEPQAEPGDGSDQERPQDQGHGGEQGPMPGARTKRLGNRTRERLRSYVFPADVERQDGQQRVPQERLLEIDAAGTARVLAYEQARGWDATAMDHFNEGYDVVSEHPVTGEVRFIEIKSKADAWTTEGVEVSKAQHRKALELGEEFWLYVVEGAEDNDLWALYCIQNPAHRIDKFLFDYGWRFAADAKAGNWATNSGTEEGALDDE